MAKVPRHRYSIGIDLGTSNCAVAYLDLRDKDARTRILDIPQWISADRSASSRLLPSFAYYPPPEMDLPESPPGPVAAPDADASPPADSAPRPTGAPRPSVDAPGPAAGRYRVGQWARDLSSQEPQRVIASAKSWLAHPGVNRRARLLPWTSREIPEAEKLSPVEASALYLSYLRLAWDEAMAGEDGRGALVRQHVTLTVPASFDQAAQKLTLEAAELAGYPARVRLLEEPQAAFHAWLERHPREGALREALGGFTPGDASLPQGGDGRADGFESRSFRILVCDIGGGTTDFSLFGVAFRSDGGAQIRREAVSNHILLGGDNMDLGIAHILESRLGGDRLDPKAWQGLVAESRILKERVLGAEFPADGMFHVGIAGSGGNLFTQSRTATVTAGEIYGLVEDGFFPWVQAGDRPRIGGGLRELGLPYASDSAITRHLAWFLASGGDGVPVDAVLFNGGALTPVHLQSRILDLISQWQEGRRPVSMEGSELDLAVARGAARHGRDIALGIRSRISGGSARSYYLETAAPDSGTSAPVKAGGTFPVPGASPPVAVRTNPYLLCILPMGTETEQVQRIDRLDLRLTVNEPVEFRLYQGALRPGDRTGNLLRLASGGFRELPPLRTVARLDAAQSADLGMVEIPVAIHARLNSLGLLQVDLVSAHKKIRPPQTWELRFDMRPMDTLGEPPDPDSSGEPGSSGTPGESEPPGSLEAETDLAMSEEIRERVSALLSAPFGPGVLRHLEEVTGRKKSSWPRTWLRQFWESMQGGLFKRDSSPEFETAWLNAAGYFLRPGFGVVLDDFRIDRLWQVHALGPAHPKNKAVRDQYWLLWRRVAGGLSAERQSALFTESLPLLHTPAKASLEAISMAASLERLSMRDKEALLNLLLAAAKSRQGQYLYPILLALGRLLSRIPLYAGEESILPPDSVEATFRFFESWNWSSPENTGLAILFSQACRVTGHRSVDVPGSLRSLVAEKIRNAGSQERLVRPILEFQAMEKENMDQLFGEPLPLGIALGRFG